MGQARQGVQLSLSGKGRRRKGHDFERDIANDLKGFFPDARRGIQTRDGTECADVVVPHWWIECKVGRTPSVRGALKQAIEASVGSNKIPVAVIKDDRRDPFIVMRYEDWKGLINTLRDASET